MSVFADARIAAFREANGIDVPAGERLAAINKLQDICVTAIKLLELEKSGIRDGAGMWLGSDVVSAISRELIEHAEIVAHGNHTTKGHLKGVAIDHLLRLQEIGERAGILEPGEGLLTSTHDSPSVYVARPSFVEV